MGRCAAWVRRNPVEAALLAAGCAARLAFLGARTPGFDESKTLVLCGQSSGTILALLPSLENAPPLYFLLMRYWTRLFADPLLGLRLFSVLCGAASLWLFLQLCRTHFPKSLPWSLVVACFSSYWVHQAQDGRPYALFLLLALLHTLAALDLERRWSVRTLAAYTAAGVAGIYTHYFFGFLLLAHGLRLVFLARPERRAALLAAHGVLALSYLPLLALVLGPQYRLAARMRLGPLTPGRAAITLGEMLFDASYLGFVLVPWVKVVGLLAAVAVLAGAMARKREGAPWYYLALGFSADKAFELLGGYPANQPRYFVFMSPFLYIALGQARALFSGAAKTAYRILLAAVVLSGTAGYFVAAVYLDPGLERLSAAIRADRDKRDIVVHLNSYHYLAMRYHFLPERAHYFVSDSLWEINWDRLPGYRAVLSPAELARRGGCLVLDPQGVASPRRFWRSTGGELAGLLPKRGA